MTILLVIDMQPIFLSDPDGRIKKTVAEEIQQFIKTQNRIFFLEFSGEGATIEKLILLTENNPLATFIQKPRADGSSEILRECKKLKLPKNKFRVVGVSTRCCVKGTILGLIEKNPKVEITLVTDGCDGSKESIEREFKHLPQVKLIN